MSDANLDIDAPFTTPKEAMEFLAREAERLKRHTNPRNKVEHRQALKVITEMISKWATLYRLQKETVSIEEMAEEIKKLKAQILGGPVGLVDAEGQ